LRLWAEGAREKILLPHLDQYAQERDLGWVKERAYLQKVCNEFHSRVDWCLEDHDEPELQAWDPKEVVEAEQLSDEEEVLRRQRIKLLNKVSHIRVTSQPPSPPNSMTANMTMVYLPDTPPP
jgi:hypothetical protein